MMLGLAESTEKVPFLNLPPPARVQKPEVYIFYSSPFAIFVKDLVKIDLAVLEICDLM